MALDEVRLVGHVAVHPAPAVFLHDQVEQVERRIVVVRIDADELALERGLEEIQRRLRHILGANEFGVVGVSDGVGGERHIGAVRIAQVRHDLLEAVGLEREQLAPLLPVHEVLHGLEEREVDLELAGGELLLDPLVEHVAEAARHRHLDARELLLELLDARLIGRGRPAGIEQQRLLGLRLFVELVDGLGARSGCGRQQRDRDAGRSSRPTDRVS